MKLFGFLTIPSLQLIKLGLHAIDCQHLILKHGLGKSIDTSLVPEL